MNNIKTELRTQCYHYLQAFDQQPSLLIDYSDSSDLRALLYKSMFLTQATLPMQQIDWLAQTMLASLAELAWLNPDVEAVDHKLDRLLDILCAVIGTETND